MNPSKETVFLGQLRFVLIFITMEHVVQQITPWHFQLNNNENLRNSCRYHWKRNWKRQGYTIMKQRL